VEQHWPVPSIFKVLASIPNTEKKCRFPPHTLIFYTQVIPFMLKFEKHLA
jgi:hypothetical protein